MEEIHQNMAILPLYWESRALGPQRAGRRQGVDFGIVGVGWRLNLYNSRVMIKLEEIHRKLAILPLHWDRPLLGPQRAGGDKGLIFAFKGSNDS